MALLMALIMVVLITAFITDFNYDARVKTLGSSHFRDDTRAWYLAKSGIRTYGLLLIFGRQIGRNSMIGSMLSSVGISMDGSAMVCKNLPFLDTAMLRLLTSMGGGMMSDEEEGGLLSLMGMGGGQEEGGEGADVPVRGEMDETEEEGTTMRRKLLDFEGDYKVDCIDESSKIDLNGFANGAWAGLTLQQHPTALMLMGLFAPREYDPLFQDRLKMDRWELIGNLRDWVDGDSQRSGIMGGDEDALYDDFTPRYRSKNSRFDTIEEARRVAGVTDEVWSTFGSAWSVHTQNFKINVNAAEPHLLRAVLRAFTDPAIVPDSLLDQKLPEILVERIFVPFRNGTDFIQRSKGKGLTFSPESEKAMKPLLTTSSRVFRLEATGYVNDSTSTIEAIVRVNSSGTRYLDWKEH